LRNGLSLAMIGVLKKMTETYPDFERLSLMDTKSIIVASTDESTLGRDFSTRNYFQNASESSSGMAHAATAVRELSQTAQTLKSLLDRLRA